MRSLRIKARILFIRVIWAVAQFLEYLEPVISPIS